MNLHLLIALALCVLMARPAQAQTQAEPVDSLMVKERHRPSDIENGGLRILTKVAAGTVSGFGTTALAVFVLDASYSDERDVDGLATVTLPLIGSAIGCSVGFPWGVSSVDPYDSLPMTLLGGVIPALVGLRSGGVPGVFFIYVGPIIGSLITPEISRNFSQGRLVSFGLAPTPNGGLSISTILYF